MYVYSFYPWIRGIHQVSMLPVHPWHRPVTHCHLRQAIPVAHAPSALAGVVEDHVKDHLPTKRGSCPVPCPPSGDLMISWWWRFNGNPWETHIWAQCVSENGLILPHTKKKKTILTTWQTKVFWATWCSDQPEWEQVISPWYPGNRDITFCYGASLDLFDVGSNCWWTI